MLNYLFFYSL